MKTYNKETMKADAIAFMRGKNRLHDLHPQVIEQLRQENQRNFEKLQSLIKVEFVSGQPYETAEELRHKVAEEGVLLISSDNNNSKLFGEDQNLKFRAVHDYFHITGCEFGYIGEAEAYEMQKLWYSANLRPILYSEIVMQAAYFDYFGYFPEDQKVVIPDFDKFKDVAKDHIRFFRTQTAGTLTQQKAYEFHFRKQHGVSGILVREGVKGDQNCDWCNGNGVSVADCGDFNEIQRCDSCELYSSDKEALDAVNKSIDLQKSIGATPLLM